MYISSFKFQQKRRKDKKLEPEQQHAFPESHLLLMSSDCNFDRS